MYKILVQKGTWQEKSPEEEQIIALQSQIKLSQSQQKNGGSSGNSNGANRGSSSQKSREEKYAWKKVHPKDGEPLEIKKNGKDYVYCPHHPTCWVLKITKDGKVHLDVCDKKKAAKSKAPAATGGSNGGGPQLQSYAAALQGMQSPDGPASDDEEGSTVTVNG